MVALFKFEEKFDRYLLESDMEEYDKHQIYQMKIIDPAEYYKQIEEYYNKLYPSLEFYIIMSDDIEEYPNNGIIRFFYIIWHFIKQMIFITPKRNINQNNSVINPATGLSDSSPSVKALTYYEWVQNDFYERLLLYFLYTVYIF